MRLRKRVFFSPPSSLSLPLSDLYVKSSDNLNIEEVIFGFPKRFAFCSDTNPGLEAISFPLWQKKKVFKICVVAREYWKSFICESVPRLLSLDDDDTAVKMKISTFSLLFPFPGATGYIFGGAGGNSHSTAT